jgi:hypothetical protein
MDQLHWMQHPVLHMASRPSNLLVVLLLTVVITTSAAKPDASMMIMARGRSAACHQHGSAAPTSQPVSYRCCQGGHDSAILQAAFAWQLSWAGAISAAEPASAVPVLFVRNARNLLRSSTSPPAGMTLRV